MILFHSMSQTPQTVKVVKGQPKCVPQPHVIHYLDALLEEKAFRRSLDLAMGTEGSEACPFSVC